MGAHHQLTSDEEIFLQEYATRMSRTELTQKFNTTFGTRWAVSTVKAWCNKRGLSNGNDGRFKKGNQSWQTGLHGDEYWSHFSNETKRQVLSLLDSTRQKYQEGDVVLRHGLPAIYQGVDSGEHLDDRIVYCSTATWVEANGQLPDDMILIHLDGDLQNYSLDNLKAIPRSWLGDLRYIGGLTDDLELNLTKLAYCELKESLRGDKSEQTHGSRGGC